MGVEIIQDPVPSQGLGESAGDMTHMGREVLAGAGRSQVADDFAGGHHERADQGAGPMADVILLALAGRPG